MNLGSKRDTNLPRAGSGAPAARWARSAVIHGAATKPSNIFSHMAPIVEWGPPLEERNVIPDVPPVEEAVSIPTYPEPVEEEAGGEIDAGKLGMLADPKPEPEPSAASPVREIVESLALRENHVVDSRVIAPAAIPVPEKTVFTAHLLKCEFCGASISKLRPDTLSIGGVSSQWSSCPSCSSARRISPMQVKPSGEGASWFLPFRYLLGWANGNQRTFFVDCSPVGMFVGLGKRLFRESYPIADVGRRSGASYQTVELPFVLETGQSLRAQLIAVSSRITEGGVLNLTMLRKPHFSRVNGTDGWNCAEMDNLVQFPSLRGLETLLASAGLKVVTTQSIMLFPITGREAQRLSTAAGMVRWWLLVRAGALAVRHTLRSGPACQVTLVRRGLAPVFRPSEE